MTYTLMTDGTSDRVLLPLITWSLKRQGLDTVDGQWADFGRIPIQGAKAEKFLAAVDLYPCDVLFVHRDTENASPGLRRDEIREALRATAIKHIPVVPVRMTEAWFLIDENAIRAAAGNPNGTMALNLPHRARLENLPDPKRVLYEALSTASGLGSARRLRFPLNQRVHAIPNYIDDYSGPDAMTSFQELQRDIRNFLESWSGEHH